MTTREAPTLGYNTQRKNEYNSFGLNLGKVGTPREGFGINQVRRTAASIIMGEREIAASKVKAITNISDNILLRGKYIPNVVLAT